MTKVVVVLPEQYKLPSVRELLARHVDRLAVLGIKLEDEPVEDKKEQRAWRKAMWERALAHVDNMPPRLAAAVRKFHDHSVKVMMADYSDLDARREKLNDYDSEKKKNIYVWYRWHLRGSDFHEPFALDYYFQHRLNEMRDETEKLIKRRMATLIACGADPVIVVRETAKAMAQGRGEGPETYPDRFIELWKYVDWHPDDPPASFDKADFDIMGELMLQQNEMSETLAFGAFTNKFYQGDMVLPKPVVESLIRDALATANIVDDDNNGAPVSVDRRMVGEVYASLSNRVFVDDRARSQRAVPPAAAAPPMLEVKAGPEFDSVLVVEAGAPFVSTAAIREACVDVWRDYCARSGVVDNETTFGVALNKWGKPVIKPARPMIAGKRDPGYVGIRIKGGQ
jgi:hypothetical protein